MVEIDENTHNATGGVRGEFLVPPTIAASRFVITANVAEILVTVGCNRVPFDANTGNPVGSLAAEWPITLSISPPAAILLKRQIDQAITEYENRFGTIPTDPLAAMQQKPIDVRKVSPTKK